jgi:hypothetical protein
MLLLQIFFNDHIRKKLDQSRVKKLHLYHFSLITGHMHIKLS